MKTKYFIMLILFLGGLGLITYQISYALFASGASNVGNSFTAAASFPPITFPITFPDSTPTPTPPIGPQPGDIVINEINWGGSFNGDDEWVELRNMTNAAINLSNWVIENLGTGTGANANITIPVGKTIPANGFFLIAHFSEATSSSNLNIAPDLISTNVNLVNAGEQLRLLTSTISGILIDTANPTGSGWLKGLSTAPRKSMERNLIPGNGTLSVSWHTASSAANLDLGATESATPKAIND